MNITPIVCTQCASKLTVYATEEKEDKVVAVVECPDCGMYSLSIETKYPEKFPIESGEGGGGIGLQ